MSVSQYPKLQITVFFILSLFLFFGCSRYRIPPSVAFNLEGIDTSPLKNKIIVLDPGHGGKETGAVGSRGLKESEVNLGVALHLWGLLKEAGAQPVLTRHTDSSVYKGNDFTLSKDLQARTALGNSTGSDLFISIHHNASEKNKQTNSLILFYKSADSGRSLDAARSIISPLKRALESENVSVRPGNYHVLRETESTAILGEASFISNRPNEKILSFQRTAMREAKGYFMGILNYFSKGIPEITRAAPQDTILKNATPEITACISPGSNEAAVLKKDIKIDIDTKSIRSFKYENRCISFTPESPLNNTDHSFCITARNSAGNISKKECVSFSVSLSPETIRIKPLFSSVPANGTARNPVDITVLDKLGRPVADQTKIELFSSSGFFLKKHLLTAKGCARSTFISAEKPGNSTVRARSGHAVSETVINCGEVKAPFFMATLRDNKGHPVMNAELLRNNKTVGLSDSQGFVYDQAESAGKTCYKLTKKGYHPVSLCTGLHTGKVIIKNISLRAVEDGVFFNKRIILDPSDKETSTFPILTDFKNKIESAGGKIMMTWEKDPPPSELERTDTASGIEADVLLSFESGDKPAVGHYYRSTRGKKLANALCSRLNKIFLNKKAQTETSLKHIIVHTPMPAVTVCLPDVNDQKISSVSTALYKALLEFFTDDSPGDNSFSKQE